jgi:hypothetical protein
MKNVSLSDAELTAYSGEHLLYELQYLFFTAKELGRYTKPEPMVSVLIESFGIHLRNLIDFFCTKAGEERTDDVIASDFCPGWSENASPTLKEAKERANKELNHLTLERKSSTDPSKAWKISDLYEEIIKIAGRFAAQADPKKLSADVTKWIQAANSPTIAVGAPLIASNTTSKMMVFSSSAVTPPKVNP